MQTQDLPATTLGTELQQARGVTQDLQDLITMVVNSLESEHSRRAYERALSDFMAWFLETGQRTLNRDVINAHMHALKARGVTLSSRAQRMAALAKVASEAQANGLIRPDVARGIIDTERPKLKGVRAGNWLTKEKARQLIEAPDATTLKGLRDRALFAILLGCGLRRSEVVSLQAGPQGHIRPNKDAQGGEWWAITNLVGKGQRVRSVPLPDFAYEALRTWLDAAGITTGPVFRPVYKGGQIGAGAIDPQTVYDVIREYREVTGEPNLAAHDLRRTFAKLCKDKGIPTREIAALLGHSSEATTERYLGTIQDRQSPINGLFQMKG